MTLNQKYKQSKSELTFKDWVLQQQKNGKLDYPKEKYNAVDSVTKPQLDVAGIPLKYLGIGLVILVGALFIIPKLRK